MNDLNSCPSCNASLSPRLKSGRVVCLKCGWTDQKRVHSTASDMQSEESNLVDEAEINESPKDSNLKSGIIHELVRLSNYILIGILGILLYSQFKKPSYEYDVVSPSDLSFSDSMNVYGKDGWKAVSCRRATSSSTDSASYECVMIREK
jgi:ribosomal protein L40E